MTTPHAAGKRARYNSARSAHDWALVNLGQVATSLHGPLQTLRACTSIPLDGRQHLDRLLAAIRSVDVARAEVDDAKARWEQR